MKQKTEAKFLSLPVASCLSHLWIKPKLQVKTAFSWHQNRFRNLDSSFQPRQRGDLLKWLLHRHSRTWKVDIANEYKQFKQQNREIPHARPHAPLHDWQVWFISHATVLLQIGPYNFLTDPVWADYASPYHGLGSIRVCPAGIALDELPKIDAVLLSHNHYDHMDLATLNWLYDHFQMTIYTGLGNAAYLPKHFKVVEMDWWQTVFFREVKIVYTPAQHGSGRGFRDQDCALWGGFSLVYQKNHCFFAGDTGYSAHFKEIRERLGEPRVALLPIGAYEPRHLMKVMHMNPADALQAHKDLHAKCSIAMHYRTFQLTDEGRDQPEHDLHQAMKGMSKFINPFYCVHEGKKVIV